jgi:hypothetical protein
MLPGGLTRGGRGQRDPRRLVTELRFNMGPPVPSRECRLLASAPRATTGRSRRGLQPRRPAAWRSPARSPRRSTTCGARPSRCPLSSATRNASSLRSTWRKKLFRCAWGLASSSADPGSLREDDTELLSCQRGHRGVPDPPAAPRRRESQDQSTAGAACRAKGKTLSNQAFLDHARSSRRTARDTSGRFTARIGHEKLRLDAKRFSCSRSSSRSSSSKA